MFVPSVRVIEFLERKCQLASPMFERRRLCTVLFSLKHTRQPITAPHALRSWRQGDSCKCQQKNVTFWCCFCFIAFDLLFYKECACFRDIFYVWEKRMVILIWMRFLLSCDECDIYVVWCEEDASHKDTNIRARGHKWPSLERRVGRSDSSDQNSPVSEWVRRI